MRKHILIAGMLIAAALVSAIPSRADSVDYTLTGPGVAATFSLSQTLIGSSTIVVHNIGGTLFGNPFSYKDLTISISSFMGVSDFWSFGSVQNQATCSPAPCGNISIFATNLFTMNPDGSVTLNGGTFQLGDFHLFPPVNSTDRPFTLTATVIPGPPVGTPEPATLALLGIGGLVLAGLRRRKAA
jgi:PEP-CTERM motif